MGPGAAGMVSWTWKIRRGASRASTSSVIGPGESADATPEATDEERGRGEKRARGRSFSRILPSNGRVSYRARADSAASSQLPADSGDG